MDNNVSNVDRSWMNLRDRLSLEYLQGVDTFIQTAETNCPNQDKIRCPCQYCLNVYFQEITVVKDHLIRKGIDISYNKWILHGETLLDVDIDDDNIDDDNIDDDNIDNAMNMSNETEVDVDDVNQILEDVRMGNIAGVDGHNKEKNPFQDLLKDAQRQLYPGCTKYSLLSAVIRLLHLKVLNHWSIKSFNMLLEFLKEILPTGELLPSSYYEARKVLRELGLGYECIHACVMDCTLFWKEFANLEKCPECGESRWKINNDKGKKIPHKVLRYFPIKSRLQRLFMSKKTTKDMRWHKEERLEEENVMRHPADSEAWKDFDKQYSWFAKDPRNVRLGLTADGFNPFGNMNNSYSMWPVILMPYNLPPWKCMKEPYSMMSLIIPGPRAPGKDIDTYLRPLLNELKDLWLEGIQTYDEVTTENFQLHAAVLWTINDFPAYGDLSGWSTKGYHACPICKNETCSVPLRSKIGYIDHRRFLPSSHPWRKSRKFNGKWETRSEPTQLPATEVLLQLESVKNVKMGKHSGNKKRKQPSKVDNWTKKGKFFELPYWEKLKIRHNLDVMHIEKKYM